MYDCIYQVGLDFCQRSGVNEGNGFEECKKTGKEADGLGQIEIVEWEWQLQTERR